MIEFTQVIRGGRKLELSKLILDLLGFARPFKLGLGLAEGWGGVIFYFILFGRSLGTG